MHSDSDFEVIRLPDHKVPSGSSGNLTTPNHIIAEIFNVSKQGKSKSQGYEEWPLPGKLEIKPTIYLDSELRNIWVKKGSRVFCLRAEGVDQELIDFSDFSYSENAKDLYLVRGTGKGTSQLCIIYSDGKITKINYDESGYQPPEEYSLADVVESVVESRTIEKPKPPFLRWKPNKQQDCRMQHPNTTSWQVGKFELRLDPSRRGSYADESFYIDWSFEDGLVENTGTPSEEMLNDKLEPIELPGGVQAFHKSDADPGKKFAFTSNASSFGKNVFGIRPFGNNPPEPRYPRTKREEDFEKDTKEKLSILEGQIRELEGRFETLSNRHD